MRNKIILLILGVIMLSTICSAITPNYAEDTSPNENKEVYGIDENYKSKTIKYNSKKTYEITPNTNPCDAQILRYTTLNKNTKHYYTLMSYMIKFEKAGGGTLVLKKGTYTISNTVAIPSNVNIILKNGVVLKKGTKTGTSKFPAALSMFQLVPPSKIKNKAVYGKYNGVSNVDIIGTGTSTIDLGYYKGGIGVVCGHNKNVNIQGITFKNLNSGHFIEVAATNKATITKCKFSGSKASTGLNKEAINLDTPDKNTKGFNNDWSKKDRTPNNNILIENNVFKDLDRAIGTHKYSQDKTNGKYIVNKGQRYHTKIVVKNNAISNTRSDSIHPLNWKDSKIINNDMSNIPKNSVYRGILGKGVVNLTIKYNKFSNMPRPVQIMPIKNIKEGSMYSVTYNFLNTQNENDLKYNLCSNLNEYFSRINNVFNNFWSVKQIPMLSN